MIKGKKSQAILGFIFALIATFCLIIGAARIWVWFNANYAKREVSYQQSRLPAAQRITPYYASGTTASESEYTKPLNLTEDWVFKGDTGDQKVGYASAASEWGESWKKSLEDCEVECLAEPGSGCGTAENFDLNCPCYVKCSCKANIAPTLKLLQKQADSLRGQAHSLYEQAKKLRDKADQCTCTVRHPGRCFRPCSWGRTRKELRRAADQLDAAAAELTAEADRLDTERENMDECCNFDTTDDQKTCFDLIGEEGCNELASQLQADWQAELKTLEDVRAEDMEIIAEIKYQISACNSYAVKTCKSEAAAYADKKCTYCPPLKDCYVDICASGCTCTKNQWQAYYDAYYPGCYKTERNACCKTFCYDYTTGSSCINDKVTGYVHSCSCWEDQWGTACDAPATDCGGDSQPQCGLSVYAKHLQLRIDNELTPAINALPNKIDNILACCEKPEVAGQMQCVADLSK